ncbi:MAG TPA: aquaporin [Candidatus Thermoplasmatota archaeon]|nr:aquaporin [Candidatus Thermoplasmatota archaeon]
MRTDLRPEAAEALGTFLMMLAGGAAILTHQPAWAVAAAFGAAVMVLIFALGHVSGAHFNPAITVAFAATRHFPWRRVPTYMLAQVAGAFAACLLLAPLGPLAPVVATGPLAGGQALAVEALATFLLAFVIIAVATDPRAAPGLAGLAIGATVGLGALVAGPLTGAAMNPARALAPALLTSQWDGLAMHLVGPFAGGLVGMLVYEGLRRGSKPRPGEVLGTAGPVDLEAEGTKPAEGARW